MSPTLERAVLCPPGGAGLAVTGLPSCKLASVDWQNLSVGRDLYRSPETTFSLRIQEQEGPKSHTGPHRGGVRGGPFLTIKEVASPDHMA